MESVLSTLEGHVGSSMESLSPHRRKNRRVMSWTKKLQEQLQAPQVHWLVVREKAKSSLRVGDRENIIASPESKADLKAKRLWTKMPLNNQQMGLNPQTNQRALNLKNPKVLNQDPTPQTINNRAPRINHKSSNLVLNPAAASSLKVPPPQLLKATVQGLSSSGPSSVSSLESSLLFCFGAAATTIKSPHRTSPARTPTTRLLDRPMVVLLQEDQSSHLEAHLQCTVWFPLQAGLASPAINPLTTQATCPRTYHPSTPPSHRAD